MRKKKKEVCSNAVTQWVSSNPFSHGQGASWGEGQLPPLPVQRSHLGHRHLATALLPALRLGSPGLPQLAKGGISVLNP